MTRHRYSFRNVFHGSITTLCAMAWSLPSHARPPHATAEEGNTEIAITADPIPEAVWNALLDKDVDIAFVNGAHRRGKLIGLDAESFVLVSPHSGEVHRYGKAHTASLRLLSAFPTGDPNPHRQDDGSEPPSGLGGVVTGSVFGVLGLGLLIAGGVLTSRGSSYYDGYGGYSYGPNVAGVAMLGSGGVHLIVAIPLLIVGGVRHARFREWRHFSRKIFAPTISVRGDGIFLGTSVRF